MTQAAMHRTMTFRRPLGISSLEVLIALTLLGSILAVSAQLVVKQGRLLTAQRQYRLALDEVSNQLERLTSMPADRLAAAIEQLEPSAFASARLPGAVLRGQLDAIDSGQRLTLRLFWDEPQRAAAPVSLAAWLPPLQRGAGGKQARSPQP